MREPLFRLVRHSMLPLYFLVYIAFGVSAFYQYLLSIPDPVNSVLHDFHIYERAVVQGLEGANPYALKSLGKGFLYPPPALVILMVSYGLRGLALPLKVGLVASVNILLVLSIVGSMRQQYERSWKAFGIWTLLFLTSASFFEILYVGQVNVLILWGITLLLVWQERHPFKAALGWILGGWLKLTPFLLVFPLWLRRRSRVLLWTAVLSLFIGVVAGGWFGWDIWTKFWDLFRWMLHAFTLDSEVFVGKVYFALPYGPPRQWFRAHTNDVVLGLQRAHTFYLFSLVVLSHVVAYVQGQRDAQEPLIITLLVFPFLSHIVWYHYYIFLLFALMVWWMGSPSRFLAVWIAIGLLGIQMSRYFLFHPFPLSGFGLLVYVFLHTSLLYLFGKQCMPWVSRLRLRWAR